MNSNIKKRHQPIMRDARDTDIVVIVMGATGAGKSSFINWILGEENRLAVGHTLTPRTVSIEPVVIDPIPDFPNLTGHRLVVVDSPGFDNPYASDTVVLQRIVTWLENSYKKKKVLGGIVYLHDISQDRFPDTAQRNLEMFNHLRGEPGDASLDRIILATTKWERVELQALGEDRESTLTNEHWKTLVEKGSQVCRFRGETDSGWEILDVFLRRALEHRTQLARERGCQIKTPLHHRHHFRNVLGLVRPEGEVANGAAINQEYTTQPDALTVKENMTPKMDGASHFELQDGRDTDIVIPVMGATGAGKSSFINSILGETFLKVGHDLKSETLHIAPVVIDPIPGFPKLKGWRLVIVDNPGFDDTYVSDVEILKRIATWLGDSYKKKMVLGGVIYLHDISLDRFFGSARKNLEMFHRLCGDTVLDKVVLATTKWARIVPHATGESREASLRNIYWKTMVDKGSQVRRLASEEHSAASWDIMNILLQRASNHMSQLAAERCLQIQDELVRERKLIPETEAGQHLRYSLEEVLAMQLQVAALESEMRENGADKSEGNAKSQIEETRHAIGQLVAQLQDRKDRLPQRISNLLAHVSS